MLTTAPDEGSTGDPSLTLTGDDIVRAWRAIAPHVRRTPTVAHRLLSRRFATPVHVKLENNQLLGSFKLRGWTALFAQFDEAQRRRGIVTAAQGEHVRALTAAAEQFGVAYKRVVSADGANGPRPVRETEMLLDSADPGDAARAAHELAERVGSRYVDPAVEPAFTAGAGTIGFELIEQSEGPLDVVFVPVGSGALAIGMAIAIKSVSPDTRIYGVQAAPRTGEERGGDALNLSAALAAQRSAAKERALDALLDKRLTVQEVELHDAIRTYAETLRQAACGAGAAALAGARQVRASLAGARIGVVLSGGNIDVWRLRRVLDGEPAEDSTNELRELVDHVYR